MLHNQHHRPSSVSQNRVEIDHHQHQGEESMVVASSSAAYRRHHQMDFNTSPPLPPLASSLIRNCFGAHQLDSMLGSGSGQAAAASSPSSPDLKHGSGDHVQLPPCSSPAQTCTTINPWAWSSAEEGALLWSKKKELGESITINSDPKKKKEKKITVSESNSDNTGARRNAMTMVMMQKKKKKVMNNKAGRRKKVREPRFCFKTMSEVDVLDDGYKWRKYGQKVVKNTQQPRSYYRCTQDNCRVKKRIERWAEDPRMVITTYEGRHVHSPSHDEDPSQTSSKLNLFW